MHAKQIALNYAEKIWNTKNIDVIHQLMDQDVLIHSTLGDFRGLKALTDVIHAWLSAFPDLSVKNTHVIAEDDLVSIQWQAKGTHTGEFKGIGVSHNPINYTGATVYRVKEDKIVEYWTYIDMQHLVDQLQ